jgi:hypothetical protein
MEADEEKMFEKLGFDDPVTYEKTIYDVGLMTELINGNTKETSSHIFWESVLRHLLLLPTDSLSR